MQTLSHHQDELVCLDEVQRMPGLFPLLRSLIDDDPRPGRFLLLGSASPDLIPATSLPGLFDRDAGSHTAGDPGTAESRMRHDLRVTSPLPESMRWLFWDLDFETLDPVLHADAVLPRVLENGRLEDVRALLAIYGRERIHRFFREVAHPLLSDRTRTFWRACFAAENEPWATLPAFRTSSAAPSID